MEVIPLPHQNFTCLTNLSSKKMQRPIKLRIVYDASERANDKAKSLNKCLEQGPNLQNLIWKILVWSSFHPIAICGDLKQAFLQIRIQENCRDSLRFHLIKDRDPQQITIHRFTRLVLGPRQSPFVFDATLQNYLERYINTYAEVAKQTIDDLYVDEWPVSLNDWVSVYDLNGCGFESCCNLILEKTTYPKCSHWKKQRYKFPKKPGSVYINDILIVTN